MAFLLYVLFLFMVKKLFISINSSMQSNTEYNIAAQCLMYADSFSARYYNLHMIHSTFSKSPFPGFVISTCFAWNISFHLLNFNLKKRLGE